MALTMAGITFFLLSNWNCSSFPSVSNFCGARSNPGSVNTAANAAIAAPNAMVDSVGRCSLTDSNESRKYGKKGHVTEQPVAAKTPVAMNVSTAARERGLRRARPQMPCPVVHPFPSYEWYAENLQHYLESTSNTSPTSIQSTLTLVPNPTKKPPAIKPILCIDHQARREKNIIY